MTLKGQTETQMTNRNSNKMQVVFILSNPASVGNGLGKDWELSLPKPKASHPATLGPSKRHQWLISSVVSFQLF